MTTQTIKSKLLYSLGLILIALMTVSPARAEVTDSQGSDISVDTGPRSNCGRLRVSNRSNVMFRTGTQRNGFQYRSTKNRQGRNLVYHAGTTLKIHSIQGDWAEVYLNADANLGLYSGSYFIRKSAFNSQHFERLKRICNNEVATPADVNNGNHTGNSNFNAQISGDGAHLVDQNHFRNAMCNLKEFYREKGRREKYAFVNIPQKAPNSYKFRTFVVDIATGRVVKDFDSLKSPRGMGCKTNHTRPGIFRLSGQMSPGTKRRPWWGRATINNRTVRAPAYVITNVGGHETKYGGGGNAAKCRSNPTIKAHMNTNMRGQSSGGRRYSYGCLITSPEIFKTEVMGKAGNSLIVNFDPQRQLHPNCRPNGNAQ